MNIKLTGLVLGTALSALAFTACENASNTNTTANANKPANSNQAVVVNSNTNATTANTYTVSTTNSWNANVTKEEYEKDKTTYADRAKQEGSKIGTGAEDGWLWLKTKASLATTDDLRDSTINVDVDNAVVTLRGTVANAAQKTKAETVAKGVKDVKSVKNDLQIKANDSMTNQMVNGNTSKSNTNANTKK